MAYSVEYRPAMSPLWIWTAVASWIGVILANVVVGLYAESVLWVVTASIAGAGWILLSILIMQVTRKSRTGTAEAGPSTVVVEEVGSWWQRVSLGGRLTMRVIQAETRRDGKVLASCHDPVWGTINVVFSPSDGEDRGRLLSDLEGRAAR